ncbi:hypothetical protein FGF1_29640 [Flavobacteriaceae bacterium GF1]
MIQNRNNILEASAHFLLQQHKGQYTMDKLAADLNCSKKTIYKYFGSKQELIQGILKSEIDKMEQEFERLDIAICDPLEKVLEALYLMNEMVRKIYHSTLYQQSQGKNLLMENYFDFRVNVFELYLKRFFKPFENDFQGGFKTTGMLSHLIIDAIEGHYFYTLKAGKRISDRDFVDGLAFLIHRTLVNVAAA